MFYKKNKKGTSLLENFNLDKSFLHIDKQNILRTSNIIDIPEKEYRTGGKTSYAEWAHVIGIFQTIIYQQLEEKYNNRILDVGCGTGLLAMACQNFVGGEGYYLGMDVVKKNIEYCNNHYTHPNLKFIHLDVNNAMYSSQQTERENHWNIPDESLDMVTALSVWTHFNEEDALFYFKEIHRVLKMGSRAIVTFFYLDELYNDTLNAREDNKGKYHGTNQMDWIFDTKAYNSTHWFYPHHLKIPENAIGITKKGMQRLMEVSGLKLIKYYPGNWKEQPGVYFQDILIFEK